MAELLKRRFFLLLPAAAFAAGQPDRLRESQRVTFTGIGPVQIGMSESQVRRVLANKLERTDFEERCSYLTPDAKGVAFMLLNSRIARVDISDGHWLTASGAGIGTAESEIHRLYPRVRTEPHPYLDEGQGHYLRVTPADPKLHSFELLFETEGNVVTSYRAGLARAVALIEGCA